MNGFVFELNGSDKVESSALSDAIALKVGMGCCEYSKMNKFENDKIFLVKDGILYLLDGVILNKNELMQKYPEREWEEVFTLLVKNDPLS